MQTAEIEHLSQVLAAVHDATRDPVTWPAALQAACAYLDGAAANIFRQDPVVQSAVILHSWNDNPDVADNDIDQYVRSNPFFPATTFVDPGLISSGGDIIPHAGIQRTRFLEEWVQPEGGGTI
jgi:hypothetical protein